MEEFIKFSKIARYNRQVVATEKIDGTNSQIDITEDGGFRTGSRNRWITPTDDNYGFSAWAYAHRDELIEGLGVGRHFGEWWGSGIQRKYGLVNGDKRWSLFNIARWCLYGGTPTEVPTEDPRIMRTQEILPECVGLVPVLWEGLMEDLDTNKILRDLRINGSSVAPGYFNAEGIVMYHKASNTLFKRTMIDDESPKSISKKQLHISH